MSERRLYRVGGHLFEINNPEDLLINEVLTLYSPFRAVATDAEPLLFTLTLCQDKDAISTIDEATARFEDENGSISIEKSGGDGLRVSLSTPDDIECARISISSRYAVASAWITDDNNYRSYALDTTMMLLYAFASSLHDTILVHASAIEHDGAAYLFLGRSGTGKSTHSRLWLDNVEGASLLNDDNPIVRIVNGEAIAYGSPWSGKTPCYLNRSAPIGAFIRLHQGADNQISRLNCVYAYASLLPACSFMRWDSPMADAVHSTLAHIVCSVPVYKMDCLPDSDAVNVCKNTVTRL